MENIDNKNEINTIVLSEEGYQLLDDENHSIDSTEYDTKSSHEDFYSNMEKITEKQKFESIFSIGIYPTDSILVFGGAGKSSTILKNLIEVENNSDKEFNIQYTIVDVDSDNISRIKSDLEFYNGNINIVIENDSMQSKIDKIENQRFDWVLITDLFNKDEYGETQLQFVDKVISECFNFTDRGIIITFDDSKSNSNTYNIRYLISYIQEYFNRYRIERINENTYVISLYTYFLSTK